MPQKEQVLTHTKCRSPEDLIKILGKGKISLELVHLLSIGNPVHS